MSRPSLFRRIFASAPEQRALGPELSALFGAAPTAAGPSVTPETALRSPSTLAAVRIISEAVGSLPIHLYERGAGNDRARDKDHPAARLLAGDWTPWASASEVRTALQVDALLHGFGAAQVVRAGSVPRELHRLDPRSVSIEIDDASGEPRFRVHLKQGGDRFLDWRDVLYVATPGSSYGRPLALIQLCREAIGVDLVMQEHAARLFANGARPSGLLKMGKPLGVEALKRLRDSWNAAHGGGPNAGRTAILEDGVSFEALQFTSTDLQFLELRRFASEEIARAFRVPPTLIGDLQRATWRNAEEMGRQFLQFCLLPWLEVWQGALERALLTPEEREERFVEFIVDDLLRADTAARFQAYRNAVGGSWLTANEARALDNRPPIEGGDRLLRQAGQTDSSGDDRNEPRDGSA